jgi:hypothetical protein
MSTLVFQAVLGGQVNFLGPNTAGTYTLNVPAASGNLAWSSSALTAGQVPYVGTGGVLQNSPALTFDGTNLTASAMFASTADSSFASTGATQISVGTTVQRPSAATGKIRFNSSLSKYEGYNGASWTSLGGATGAGSEAVFYENGKTVTASYTITAGNNAMSTGPITVASGQTVTVPTGSRWVVL